jgi:hypothetical protein
MPNQTRGQLPYTSLEASREASIEPLAFASAAFCHRFDPTATSIPNPYGHLRTLTSEFANEPQRMHSTADWPRSFAAAVVLNASVLATMSQSIAKTDDRIFNIEQKLTTISEEVSKPRNQSPFTLVITTLHSSEYELRRDVPVLIEQVEEEEFVASFVDADVYTSGETMSAAIENLRAALISTLRTWSSVDTAKLGPLPRRQLATLERLLRRTGDVEANH